MKSSSIVSRLQRLPDLRSAICLAAACSTFNAISAEISWYWSTTVGRIDNYSYAPGQAESVSGSGPANHVGTKLEEIGSSSASAFLSTEYGILKAEITGQAVGRDGGGGYAYNQVITRWEDTLTLDSPDLHGKIGTLTYSFYVPGSFNLSTGGLVGDQTQVAEGGVEFTIVPFEVSPSRTYAISYSSYRGGSDTEAYPLIPQDGLISVTQSFVFGHPVLIGASLSLRGAAVSVYHPGASSYDLDYGHSAYWNGITDITVDGQSVTGWNVSSESGVDYSRSFVPPVANVPDALPGVTAWMAVVSLGMWHRLSRSRQG